MLNKFPVIDATGPFRYVFRVAVMLTCVCMILSVAQPATVALSAGITAAPEAPVVQLLLNGSYMYTASVTVADIDPHNGNGKEIILGGRTLNPDGSLGCEGKVHVVRANGTLWWDMTVRADIASSAAVGDLNGDGYGDVVVGMGGWNADGENAGNECGRGDPNAPGNGGVVALNGHNGSILWTFDTADWGEWATGPNGVLDGVFSSPAIGDVNGDGFLEVTFSAWDNCIYLVDRNGNSLWGRTPFLYDPKFCNQRGFFNHDTAWSSPALADLDADGKLEIIVGGDISCTNPNNPSLCNYYMEPNGGFLWVIRANGSYIARRWFDQAIFSSPAIADVDRDHVPDIIVGTGLGFPNTGYYVTAWTLDTSRAPTEALVQKWRTTVVGRTLSSPGLGDLDGNGVLDVAIIIKYGENGVPAGPAANNGSYIYALRGNDGSVMWQTHACNNDGIGRSFPIDASVVLADITGDNRPEVWFPHAWEVHALNSNGSYYTRVNTANGCATTSGDVEFTGNPSHGGSFSASVAVTDLTGDGTTEIIAPGRWDEGSGSNRGVLYIWRVNRVGAQPWPMFHANGRHVGVPGPLPPRSRASSPVEVSQPSVTVSWSGTDDESGIASYAIQVRQGTTGNWTTWKMAARPGSAIYTSAAPCGTRLYFRSVATDLAGNVEPKASSAYDSSTLVLSNYAIAGKVVNNAGQPIFKAAVSSTSACTSTSTNSNGQFALHYVQSTAAATIAATRSGFGQLPPLQGLATGSTGATLVLPPLNDVIQNGGFERGDLSGWVGSQVSLSRSGHSGQYAAQVPGGGSLQQQTATVPAAAMLSLLYRVSNPTGATGTVTLFVDPVTLDSTEQRGAGPLAGIVVDLPVNAVNWRQAVINVSQFTNRAVSVRLAAQGGIVALFDDLTLGSTQPGSYNAYQPAARR